jgi:MHS family alpha-ketoglutarate permease-like MFS transporter
MSSQSVVSLDDAEPLAPAIATRSPRLKAIVVGSLGNLVEWYDFYAYAAFSLFFAKAFFPAGDAVAQQLNAAVLFAAGFLMRPIGSWVFGHLADRYGRRRTLLLSVLLMCVGSLLIAVTPTYARIGVAAPALLGLARLLQGFSLGGEYGISAAYLCEVADEKRRGFYSSFQYVTIIGGQLCAVLLLLVLQKFLLTAEELYAWGWRIPFVIGAALAIVSALMRRDLHETDAFAEAANTRMSQGTLGVLRDHRREALLVVGLTIGGTAAFYTYTVYMQKFLKLSVGLSDDQTMLVTAASLTFAMILQPFYGALSDLVGRRWLLIGFGASGTLLTIPLLTALQATHDALSAFLLIAVAWLIVSGYTATSAVVKSELFPTLARARGVGIPYALTLATFGGTVEPIALWFKAHGAESWFYVYLTGCIAISLIVYVLMRDTMKVSAMRQSR